MLVTKAGGTKGVHFYGIGGELLGVYRAEWDAAQSKWVAVRVAARERVYFAGRLMYVGNDKVLTDRLGSMVRLGAASLGYHPYGQQVGGATANDTPKFATYTRDAASGLDYAMNRYYYASWGRFTTPDPYQASGGVADPGSWNRYGYVGGDPVNYIDPPGLIAYCPSHNGCRGPEPDKDYGADIGGPETRIVEPDSSGGRGGGGGAAVPDPRESEFRRDMAAAKVNWEKASTAIRNAVPQNSRFTPQMMDCMAGLESAWNPKSDGPGDRTGLYQYDKVGWEGDTDTPYSVDNVQNIALSVAAALNGLAWRYAASEKHRPDRTAEQHLARAFSLFNGEEKYGEYGYGQAILDCATWIDTDFEKGFRPIWNLLNPIKSQP